MDKKKERAEQKWRNTSYHSRRSPVRRNARRRKIRLWALYFLMTICILCIGIALSLTVLFKIDTVEVVGDTRYDTDQIIALSGIEKGQNLFLCKTQEGSNAIEHALPYIETADITRSLPSKIQIHITETVPVGLVEYQGQYIVISSSGKVLETTTQVTEGLPIIKGLEIQSAEVGSVMEYQDDTVKGILEDITQAITATGMQDIKEIDLTSPTNPKLNYQDRILIKLGQPIDLVIKLRNAMVALQPEHIQTYERGTLDLSLTAEDGRSFFNPDYVSGVNSQQDPSSEGEDQSNVSSSPS